MLSGIVKTFWIVEQLWSRATEEATYADCLCGQKKNFAEVEYQFPKSHKMIKS